MQKRKICLISNVSKGVVLFRLDFIKDLIKLGHSVIVVCLNDDPQAIQTLKQEGCEVVFINFDRCSKNPFQDLNYCYKLYTIIRKNAPDIVLNYTIKPVIYGSLAAKMAKVTRIYSLVPGLGHTFIAKGRCAQLVRFVVALLYKMAFSVNQKVFFLNPDDQQEFLQRKLLPMAKQVLLNGEGISLSSYPYSNTVGESINFLIIARLIKDKGVLEFLQAARVLKENFPNVKFNVVGPSDPSYPNAISLAKLSSFNSIVNYAGVVDDVRPFIENCSVYVLPSYREGTPRSTLEAMAMGRPIITTDVPGCRETVVDGVNGFLVLSDSADFHYKCSDYYAPQYESGIIWNDPEIGIEWPLAGEPIMSAKDQVYHRLSEISEDLLPRFKA